MTGTNLEKVDPCPKADLTKLSDLHVRVISVETRMILLEDAYKTLEIMKDDIHRMKTNSELTVKLAEQREAFEREKKEDLKHDREETKRREDRRDRLLLAIFGLVMPLAGILLYYALDYRIYLTLKAMSTQ